MVAIVEKEKTLNQSIIPNRWITSTWENLLEISQTTSNDKAKFYYYQGQYYSENSLSTEHGANHYLTSFLVNLYCMMCKIPLKGYTNCSYRKVGIRECQPDISYYVGDRTQNAPQSSAIVDLERKHFFYCVLFAFYLLLARGRDQLET